MMKKVITLFLVIVLMSSCFGGDEQSGDGLSMYSENQFFDIRIPTKWKVIEDTSNILPKPKTGNIELAITSNVKTDDFANSLVVLSEELDTENISSTGYIKSVFLKNKDLIPSITNIKEKTISFGKGEKAFTSKVYIFDAKYSQDTPTLRYFQTGQVCGNKGFVMTLSLPTTVDDLLKYEYMLSHFRCK